MSTVTRPPNKTLWALDEAVALDGALAGQVGALVGAVRREMEAAQGRFDKAGQARLGEMLLTVAELQMGLARLTVLHRLARANEYDRR